MAILLCTKLYLMIKELGWEYIFSRMWQFFSDFANSFSLGDGEGEGRLVSKVCGSIAIRDVQMR